MRRLLPLMQREWLQHRFGWAVAASVPLVLILLLSSFGQIQMGDDAAARVGPAFPALVATIAIIGCTALMFLVLWASSGIIISGLARRDVSDRSIEFWLSMPAGHSESIAAPLIVHLLLVPAAALLVGLLGGYLVSLVLVVRIAGIGAWLSLPWSDLLPASLAVVGRLLAGLPLATLWLSPLILGVVLTTAWFRRWGWAILIVGLGLGGLVLKNIFGQPVLNDALNGLMRHGLMALFSFSTPEYEVRDAPGVLQAIHDAPAYALQDLGKAVRDLASPLLAGGLLAAAAFFALLVHWRQRGAGAAN